MKKIVRTIVMLLFSLLTTTSCNKDDNSAESHTQSLYDMNRAALSKMDVGVPIAVMGHKSQDADAVCSSIAMATLMQQLGMDAQPYLHEKPIQAVKYILDRFYPSYPQVKTSIESGAPIVLTDHNDPMQAVSGVLEANVVGIIDHHNVSAGNVTSLPIYYKCMDVGSACTIVYSIYRECGITPSRQMAQLMLAGIIADTDSLAKATATRVDAIALENLQKIAALNDLGELTQGIKNAGESFDGMTNLEIFLSDIKSYEIGGIRLAITSLDATQDIRIDDLCERMRSVMPEVAEQLDVQMVFAKMEETLTDENGEKQYITHFAYYGSGAKEVAEQTYGSTTHDNCIVLHRKLSRKTDIVPDLTAVLTE